MRRLGTRRPSRVLPAGTRWPRPRRARRCGCGCMAGRTGQRICRQDIDFIGSVLTVKYSTASPAGTKMCRCALTKKPSTGSPRPEQQAQGTGPLTVAPRQDVPKISAELNALYAGGQVDFTMTYGPAELTKLVADGTYPAATKVLTLQGRHGRQRQLPGHTRNIRPPVRRHGRREPGAVPAAAGCRSRPPRLGPVHSPGHREAWPRPARPVRETAAGPRRGLLRCTFPQRQP